MDIASHPTPARVLVISPNAYGDLVLLDAFLRRLRAGWPATTVAVLIQERYQDLTPLLAPGVTWLTTPYNPYREGVDPQHAHFAQLRQTVTEYAPDCLVAACFDKTWLEAVVATFVPHARQVSLGAYHLDPISQLVLSERLAVDWPAIYPEKVMVERDLPEWEKHERLARHLLPHTEPARRPAIVVPADAQAAAETIVREAGLEVGQFIACCPAGVATVAIKAWPPARFGEVVAWLQQAHGRPVLLLGHQNELARLTEVQEHARAHGAAPAVWTGADGQIAVLAGLLAASRLYFGNDTGAMHLAAALGRPVVTIFGGGHWPRFPSAGPGVTVVQPLPCFGCGWECYFGDAPCVQTIPVEPVRQALTRALTTELTQPEQHIVTDALSPAEQAWISQTTAAARARDEWPVRGSDSPNATIRRTDLQRFVQQFEASEADRAARLRVIEQQGVELGQCHQERERLDGEVRQLRLRAQEFETTGEHLTREVTTLQATITEQTATREVAQQQAAHWQAAADTLRSRGAELQAALVALESERARLTEQFTQQALALEESLRQETAAHVAEQAAQLAAREEWAMAQNELRQQLARQVAAHQAREREWTGAEQAWKLQREQSAQRIQSLEESVRTESAALVAEQSAHRVTKERLEQETQSLAAEQSVHRATAGRLEQQTQSLTHTLESLSAARARILELQTAMTRLEAHPVVRFWRWCRRRGRK